nr:MAG TPA: hypothetical protein [Caudoviricetes sp.]
MRGSALRRQSKAQTRRVKARRFTEKQRQSMV